RTRTSREIIETSVSTNLQIHWQRNPTRKVRHGSRDGIKKVYPATTQVGEKVFSDEARRELDRGRIVKSSSRNGAPKRVCVGKQRRTKCRIARRTFAVGPTVIGSRDAVVDLFPGVLADVVDEHPARSGLKRKRERIAQSERPDGAIVSDGLIEKRIVSGNRSVSVDAQHLSEPVAQRLRV